MLFMVYPVSIRDYCYSVWGEYYGLPIGTSSAK